MRRKRKHGGSQDEAEVDMTPMLDVTFIMLIFFIVTISFVHVSGINVSRPSGSPKHAQTQNTQPIVIQVKATGAIIMGGREISIAAIQGNVQQALAANEDAPVIVVASGRA